MREINSVINNLFVSYFFMFLDYIKEQLLYPKSTNEYYDFKLDTYSWCDYLGIYSCAHYYGF